MTEDELLHELALRKLDPKRATSAGAWCRWEEVERQYPPASAETAREAAERFGFPLPPLLIRIWTEVANGGVGPGYGLFGLEGGLEDSSSNLTLPDLFLICLEEPDWVDRFENEPPAASLVPLCEWGCGTFSAIDCSKPGGNMLLFVDGVNMADQKVTFAKWLEDWIAGADVGSAGYRSEGGLGEPQCGQGLTRPSKKSGNAPPACSSEEFPPEAIAELRKGHKIDAIKIVRETWGLGLKESKDAVDDYATAHPEVVASSPSEPSPP